MSDIGEIIFLILALVVASITSAENKKKRKKATSKKAPTRNLPNSLEDLERKLASFNKEDFLGEKEEKKYTNRKETIFDGQEIEEVRSYTTIDNTKDNRMKPRLKESEFKTYMTSRPMEVEIIDDVIDKSTFISLENPYEAQKAVIYSEIFNRKYH